MTHIAQTLTAGRVLVVLGADRLRLRAHLSRVAPSVTVVVNRDWRSGMAGSLRTGLNALPQTADAALLMLSDQPAVSSHDLARLIHCWRRQRYRPVAAHYNGRNGVPAILPRCVFRSLQAERGDAGARGLLRGRNDVIPISMPSAAVDIDTPADLDALQSRRDRRNLALPVGSGSTA